MRGPKPEKQESAERLAKFAEQLAPNSVAIITSNPERTRSRDTEYKYRQSSHILYLNGFPEPHSTLIVSNRKGQCKVTMLVLPKDPAMERWTGIREGVEGARENYLADEAYQVDETKKVLRKLLKKAKHVYHKLGNNPEFDKVFLKTYKGKKKKLRNPETILDEMRLHKSGQELELMRHASNISAESHREVMMYCKPGMFEYELQAVGECTFITHGANAPSYNTIMAGGPRATVLHYDANCQRIEDGQLVLNDSACEYKGYASDITRTFPANGRFTEAQREIYELVLKAQEAAIAAAKPGARLGDLHNIATDVMEDGLIGLGILTAQSKEERKKLSLPKEEKKKKKGKKARKEEKKDETPLSIRDFFMHGTSHWIGIDVHDVGNYETDDGTRSDKGRGKRRKLEPGMVFTVEPGLYFDAGDIRVPERYRGIGVRIEDNIVITQDGHEVITGAVPKTVAEIEALMAAGRSVSEHHHGANDASKSCDSGHRNYPGIH
jgi:Xaa-Pro aminopeptidase